MIFQQDFFKQGGKIDFFILKDYTQYYPKYEKLNIKKYPLWMNDIGLYSISKPTASILIAETIRQETSANIIIEGFGGFGGDTIQLLKRFKKVISYEPINYKILEHNVNNYMLDLGLKNWKLKKSEFKIDTADFSKNDTAYFLDPPWGGNLYKNKDRFFITLPNGDFFHNLVKRIISKFKCPIFCKLPYNHDLEVFGKVYINFFNLGFNNDNSSKNILFCKISPI